MKTCKKSDPCCPYHACMSNHCQYNEVKANHNGKTEWVRHCKMATYVLMVSTVFPATHKKKGLPTYFVLKISSELKIHTIRSNYELWKKRIDRVNEGKAVLELRFWTGKPYASKQQTFYALKQGEVGIQKIQRKTSELIDNRHYVIDGTSKPYITTNTLAKNDGLGTFDFMDWFKGFGNEPKAIIHFTKFRY